MYRWNNIIISMCLMSSDGDFCGMYLFWLAIATEKANLILFNATSTSTKLKHLLKN